MPRVWAYYNENDPQRSVPRSKVIMPRVCNRANCGQLLLNPDGTPSFRKHFCSTTCLYADNREKKQAMRAKVQGKRCVRCGQTIAKNAPVCADKPLVDAISNKVLPTTKDLQIAPLPNPQ